MSADENDLHQLGELPADPSAGAVEMGWRTPVSRHTTRARVPFPLEALPAELGRFAAAVAQETETPVALAGMLAWQTLASVVGGSFVVSYSSGYAEPLVLWLLVGLQPGARKSAVLPRFKAPLLAWERERFSACQQDIRRLQSRRQALEAAHERLIKKHAGDIAKGEVTGDLSNPAIERVLRELNGLEAPPAYRLFADDATPESLVELLGAHPPCLAILTPEAGPLEHVLGRYRSAGKLLTLDVYNKSYDGERVREDRKTRSGVLVERPLLSIGAVVQPSVLKRIVTSEQLRERGFVARFMIVAPESTLGHRRFDLPPIPGELVIQYAKTMERLLALRAQAIEGAEPRTSPRQLTLSPGAQELWLAYCRSLEPRMSPESGELAFMSDFVSKMTGRVLRLAGLHHVGSRDRSLEAPIGEDSMQAGILMADYLLDQARAVLDGLGEEPSVKPRTVILRALQRNDLRTFSKKELFDIVRGTLPRTCLLDEPLAQLCRDDWLAKLPDGPSRPGRKSERYAVNPALFEERAGG